MTKKKIDEEIIFPPTYYVVGGDISLKRPGFSIIEVNNKHVVNKIAMCIDNKKDTKKPKGQLLNDIIISFPDFIKRNVIKDIPVFFVREKYISSHNSTYESTIYKAVGITDWIIWMMNPKNVWYELYPVTIKKIMTGNGKAEKQEVADALNECIGFYDYKTDDESDAMAVAIAWLIQNNQFVREDKSSEENISL